MANELYVNDMTIHDMTNESSILEDRLIKFDAIGDCRALVSTLRNRMSVSSSFAQRGASCIANLAAFDLKNEELGEVGGCEVVLSIMKMYSNNGVVIESCLRAITFLARDVNNRQLLLRSNCSSVIMGIFRDHLTNADVIKEGFLAVSELVVENIYCIQFSEYHISSSLFMLLTAHITIPDVVKSAAKAIKQLAVNLDLRIEMGTLGLNEALVSGLKSHLFDAGVADQCCLAIGNLSLNNDINRASLGEVGACEAVAQALKHHISDAAVAEQGCWAIANLTPNNGNNRVALGRSGACEAVVMVLQIHQDDTIVCEQGCWAIVNLGMSHNINNAKFGDSGGIIAVIEILSKHTASAKVAEFGLWAVGNLCMTSSNLSFFKETTIFNLILSVLALHADNSMVVTQALWALSMLSTVPDYVASFHNATSGRLYESLAFYVERYPSQLMIVELLSTALANLTLCLIPSSTIDVKELPVAKIIDNQLHKAMIEFIGRYPANQSVLFQCLNAVKHMSLDTKINELYLSTDILDMIIKVMHSNSSNAVILEAACQALSSLTLSEAHIKKLFSLDVGQFFLRLFSNFISVPAVITPLCHTFTNTLVLPSFLEYFQKSSICTLLHEALSLHQSVMLTVEHLSLLVAGLAANQDVCQALLGTNEIFARILKKFVALRSKAILAPTVALANLSLPGPPSGIPGPPKSTENPKKKPQTKTYIIANKPTVGSALQAKDSEKTAIDTTTGGGGGLVDNQHSSAAGHSGNGSGNQHSSTAATAATTSSATATGIAAATSTLSVVTPTMLANSITTNIVVIHKIFKALALLCAREDACVIHQSLNTCEVVMNILKHATTNAEVTQYGCSVISKLAALESNRIQFGDIGACEHVLVMVKMYMQNLGVIEACSAAIGMLANNCGNNKMKLLKSGVCEEIVTFLRIYRKEPHIAGYTYYAIQHLTAYQSNINAKFAELGTADVVIHSIKAHITIPEIVELGLTALINLSTADRNKTELIDHGVRPLLIHIFREHIEVPMILELGCTTLGQVVPSAALKKYRIKPAATFQIHEAVVVICSLCEDDLLVSRHAMWIINYLTDKHVNAVSNMEKFCEAGVVGTLLTTMKNHKNDTVCVEYGSWIVKRFTGGSFSKYRIMLGDEGACEVVVANLEIHLDRSGIVETCIAAITNLAIDHINGTKLMAVDVCRHLAAALKKHSRVAKVMEYAFAAIANLASQSSQYKSKFGENGACDGVVEGMCTHTHVVKCARFGFLAVSVLAHHNKNGMLFSKIPNCSDSVVKIFKKHIAVPSVAEYGCCAIANLATNEVNRTLLGKAGACEVIVTAMTQHINVAAVVEQGCWAIANLTPSNGINRVALGRAGACEAVVMVLQVHIGVATVAEQGCWAVKNLAVHDPGNNMKFDDVGVCEALVSIMSVHISNAGVAEQFCGAAANLAINDHMKRRLVEAGVCESLFSTLLTHSTTPGVVIQGCLAINNLLSEDHILSREKFIAIRIADVLRTFVSNETGVFAEARERVLKTLENF